MHGKHAFFSPLCLAASVYSWLMIVFDFTIPVPSRPYVDMEIVDRKPLLALLFGEW